MSVKIETVKRQADEWCGYYTENNNRGRHYVDFALKGDQWDNMQAQVRSNNSKESLTFNLVKRNLLRLKAQARELDFTLNLAPININYQDNVEETNAFRMALSSVLLSNRMTDGFARVLDKCCEYGYAVAEIGYGYESDESLCAIPLVKVIENPSWAFFDKNASHLNKIDGRFCGLRRSISKGVLLTYYPNIKDKNWLLDENEVIDYWYRKHEYANFILLKTGVYKREDLLTIDDEENIQRESDDIILRNDKPLPLIKKVLVDKIYFQRFCNDNVLDKERRYPTDDLPLIYHDALTITSYQEDGHRHETYPFVSDLEGAQKLHNFINSQIATIAKKCSGDRWLFGQGNIITSEDEENAKTIESAEGSFRFSGDVATIRRERSAELPISMIQMAEVAKREIDEIAGAMLDAQASDQAVVSGVALDKITKNIGIVNIYIISAHIRFVNVTGMLIRQMIPRLMTEERILLANKKDGSGEAIIINQYLPSGEIRNNIKDINNNFHYEITSGASSTMQKENTIKFLLQAYQINPQLFNNTADIFFRNLELPDASELERRAAVGIDPNLIKYSNGEMSLQDFQQAQMQRQQQQMQQQMQMMMQDPQTQALLQAAVAEQIKANAQKFDAETKRMMAETNAQTNQAKVQIEAGKVAAEIDIKKTEQAIDIANTQLEAVQKTIDEARLGSTEVY